MKLFIDVQGTLISDKDRSPLPGALEFIEKLNRKKIEYVVITNNTKSPSGEFLRFLQKQGFAISEECYIDPLMVLREVLRAKRVAGYGVPSFLDVLKSQGYELDYTDPEAVVLSVKSDYTFEEFAQIDEFLLGGAKLVGMHKTTLYVKDGRRYPSVGALLAMFEYACSVKSQVVGKPSELFYKKALEKIGGSFEEVTIISDDVVGDLAGAKKLGMRSLFVLTGKFRSADEIVPKLEPALRPDLIAKDLKEAAKLLGVV